MYDMWLAYGQSKTALMLFAVGLAQRLGPKGLTAFSIHPGAIWTNLTRDVTDEDWGGPGASKYLRCIYVDRHLDTALNVEERLKTKTFSQGTATYFVAAFDPKVVGKYLSPCRVCFSR